MINLQKLNKPHLQSRVELLNNPEIFKTLNVNEYFTLDKTILWFNSISTRDDRHDFAIYNDNIIIGMCGLTGISDLDKRAELYIYISPTFQGKGLGYEAINELCRWGFKERFLNKIFLYTFSDNTPANKLYEKVSFKLEGVLRKHTYKNGEFKDRNIYGLLKDEFYKKI